MIQPRTLLPDSHSRICRRQGNGYNLLLLRQDTYIHRKRLFVQLLNIDNNFSLAVNCALCSPPTTAPVGGRGIQIKLSRHLIPEHNRHAESGEVKLPIQIKLLRQTTRFNGIACDLGITEPASEPGGVGSRRPDQEKWDCNKDPQSYDRIPPVPCRATKRTVLSPHWLVSHTARFNFQGGMVFSCVLFSASVIGSI